MDSACRESIAKLQERSALPSGHFRGYTLSCTRDAVKKTTSNRRAQLKLRMTQVHPGMVAAYSLFCRSFFFLYLKRGTRGGPVADRSMGWARKTDFSTIRISYEKPSDGDSDRDPSLGPCQSQSRFPRLQWSTQMGPTSSLLMISPPTELWVQFHANSSY
jgi:hypothetical protein